MLERRCEKLTIFSNGTERKMQVTKSPMGSPVATSPVIVPAVELPSGKVFQLTLFPGFEPVPSEQITRRRGRR